MSKKINVFIDFDGTLADTIQCMCELYEADYKEHPDFSLITSEMIQTYSFDECILAPKHDLYGYFDSKRFFDNLKLFPDSKEIYTLPKEFKPIIVTVGSPINCYLKGEWIHNNFPGIDAIFITDLFGKKLVNMEDGWLIDDNIDNLRTSNASAKYVFGPKRQYNNSTYPRFENMTQAMDFIKKRIYPKYV